LHATRYGISLCEPAIHPLLHESAKRSLDFGTAARCVFGETPGHDHRLSETVAGKRKAIIGEAIGLTRTPSRLTETRLPSGVRGRRARLMRRWVDVLGYLAQPSLARPPRDLTGTPDKASESGIIEREHGRNL
jgi:hypothetical protein